MCKGHPNVLEQCILGTLLVGSLFALAGKEHAIVGCKGPSKMASKAKLAKINVFSARNAMASFMQTWWDDIRFIYINKIEILCLFFGEKVMFPIQWIYVPQNRYGKLLGKNIVIMSRKIAKQGCMMLIDRPLNHWESGSKQRCTHRTKAKIQVKKALLINWKIRDNKKQLFRLSLNTCDTIILWTHPTKEKPPFSAWNFGSEWV